jgi:DNA replication protein DnaC
MPRELLPGRNSLPWAGELPDELERETEKDKAPGGPQAVQRQRFALLVDAEWRARENKRLTRALQEAKFKLPHACIEAIDYPARRELDKALIRQLASCRWVEEHQQVLINGATGVGKTFIACALGTQACRKGFRARYWRA